MKRVFGLALLILGAFVGLLAAGNRGWGPIVITREDQQKVVLRLGEVRDVTSPGLALRIPFLDRVRVYDRRWLHLTTEALPIQTQDGEQLMVDNYVIWRIEDPVAYRRSFPGGINDALERIDRAVRDDVREVIGRHTLTQVLKDARAEIMREITRQTQEALADKGISVADVRINRTELPAGTEESVYGRMMAERGRLARGNRAKGEEKARRIRAETDREARVIVAHGWRDAEIARGEGDAESTRIYAEAYETAPEFFAFLRSLEAYRKSIGERTTLVLSPKAEFFQLFQGSGFSPEPKRRAPRGGPESK